MQTLHSVSQRRATPGRFQDSFLRAVNVEETGYRNAVEQNPQHGERNRRTRSGALLTAVHDSFAKTSTSRLDYPLKTQVHSAAFLPIIAERGMTDDVRDMRSSIGEIIHTLGEGHQLEIKGKQDVWMRVSWKQKEVFVKEFLLRPVHLF